MRRLICARRLARGGKHIKREAEALERNKGGGCLGKVVFQRMKSKREPNEKMMDEDMLVKTTEKIEKEDN